MMQSTTNTTPPVNPSDDSLKKLVDQTLGLKGAIKEMLQGADQLNKVFGQSRERATEMMKAVSDAAQRITRLGGTSKDVFDTMNKIASETGRNVIANADVAAGLYATFKVTGIEVGSLVEKFADVGVQFSNITEEMKDSTQYVRDMGLNTQKVMGMVASSFSKLNEYNFEGGVQGLTKMAAKATMFRIDMGQAFNLAEKVITPEGAVEVASAFQRLGVAAGNMVDPFSLMNASINDPGALQDTIVNIGKQFTYFDEKTKSFKINPQGMLTLRALEKETGLSYEQLTKAGLAAAELDKRLSQISPSIKFENEEDKMYLSNIAQMGKGGKYEVTLEDGSKKDISEINQKEFDKLIGEQKKADMGIEEVAIKQLGYQESMAANIKSILEAIPRGVASTSFVRENFEGFKNVMDDVLGPFAKGLVDTNVVRENMDDIFNSMKGTIKDVVSSKGKVDKTKIKEKLGGDLGKSTDQVVDIIKKLSEDAYKNLQKSGKKGNSAEIEMLAGEATDMISKIMEAVEKKANINISDIIPNAISGLSTESALSGGLSDKVAEVKKGGQSLIDKVSQSLNVDGIITIKIDAPPGVTTQQLQEYVNNDDLKRSFWNFVQKQMVDSGMQKNKTLGK